MLGGMFGRPQALYVDAGQLQAQLETELLRSEAMWIASLAAAFDATLKASPAIDALLVAQTAPAIAALYGAMLLTIHNALNAPILPDETRTRIAALRLQVDQIVRLAQLDIPEPATQDMQDPAQAPADVVDSVLQGING